jgi:hypothetical protein
MKDVIHVGFHDFPLQPYHAEWTGVSDKNITVLKSHIDPNNNRVETKEQLAYVSDLNNITGNVGISGRTTTNALTVTTEVIIKGHALIEDTLMVYKNLSVIKDATIGGNLQVMGNISGDVNVTNIDTTNITIGTINSARLPPPYDLQYYPADYDVALSYNGVNDTAPTWTRIATINKKNKRMRPNQI